MIFDFEHILAKLILKTVSFLIFSVSFTNSYKNHSQQYV